MAPKRPAPPSPPASSSSGEEEDSGNSSPPAKQKTSAKKAKPQPPPPASPPPQPAIPADQNSSSGDSESEDDDEDAGTGKYTVQPTTQKPKSPEQTASDESSSGSESESEPESPPSKPVTRSGDPKVKPINSKPMSAKDAGKGPPPSTPSKTAAEPSVSDEEPPKKQPFQRIWTEESEVEILKGVLDFNKEGRDPFSEMGSFHDRVRKLIDISCSKTQLADKLRRLKKKYENNAKRGKKGKDPEFTKAHEKTGFELSKQIWGPKKKLSSDDDKAPKANGPAREEVTDSKGEAPKASKASRNVKKDKPTDSLIDTTPSQDAPLSEETRNLILQFCSKEVDMCESLVKQAVDLMDPSKVHELVEKWEEVKIMEMELFAKRSDFSKELMKTILDLLKG